MLVILSSQTDVSVSADVFYLYGLNDASVLYPGVYCDLLDEQKTVIKKTSDTQMSSNCILVQPRR